MYTFLSMLTSVLAVIILAAMYYHSKNHAVDQICQHPDLSDEKVSCITTMMMKQHKNTVPK